MQVFLGQSMLPLRSSHLGTAVVEMSKTPGLKGHLLHARTSAGHLKRRQHADTSLTCPRYISASLKMLYPIPCACSLVSCASLVYLPRKVFRSATDGTEDRPGAQECSLASDDSGLASIPSPPGPKASGKQSGGGGRPGAGRLSEMKY